MCSILRMTAEKSSSTPDAASAALIRGGLSEPVAYMLTGAAAALVSAVLIATGLSRLSGDALKPSIMLDQVQRDKVAAKEMVR